jgi:NitT/TauT family transport system substrate-binding protein
VRRIRIGYLSTTYHTSFILMGTDWIQRRMNLKVDWKLFPTGPEMVKAFAGNELDIGYLGLPPAMIGIDKKLPIKCVAGGHMEGTVLTAKKSYSTLKELKDLRETLNQFKGKTIGTPSKGSIHDVIIRNFLDKYSLQLNITVKNFRWADQIIEAMEEGDVDAGVGTPPLAVLASRLLGAKTILPPHIMWPHNPSYGIIVTLEMIRSRTQVLEDFLRLHEKACNLIRKNPLKAAEIAADTLGMVGKSFVLEVYRVSPKYCSSLSKQYTESTLSFVPFLQKTGYINKPLAVDDVFYKSLTERIHPEKPHYDDPGKLIKSASRNRRHQSDSNSVVKLCS